MYWAAAFAAGMPHVRSVCGVVQWRRATIAHREAMFGKLALQEFCPCSTAVVPAMPKWEPCWPWRGSRCADLRVTRRPADCARQNCPPPLVTAKFTPGRVWSVAFSPDGRTIASASDDGVVAPVGRCRPRVHRRFLGGHEGPVLSVSFSPDRQDPSPPQWRFGTMLALWDVASRRSLGDPLRGQKKRVYQCFFQPPTGGPLPSAGLDGQRAPVGRCRVRRPWAIPWPGMQARSIASPSAPTEDPRLRR